MVLVKSADVPTYERGAVDMASWQGSTLESGAEVYELVDLGFALQDGGCQPFHSYRRKPNLLWPPPENAQAYFRDKDQPIETITLHGSVELAPLAGLTVLWISWRRERPQRKRIVHHRENCALSARLW